MIDSDVSAVPFLKQWLLSPVLVALTTGLWSEPISIIVSNACNACNGLAYDAIVPCSVSTRSSVPAISVALPTSLVNDNGDVAWRPVSHVTTPLGLPLSLLGPSNGCHPYVQYSCDINCPKVAATHKPWLPVLWRHQMERGYGRLMHGLRML